MQMLHLDQIPQPIRPAQRPVLRSQATGHTGNQPFEAKVKPQFVELYPGVDPKQWYRVVQEGEYKDDMEGLWIQVTEKVTYVLAKHFDLQARPEQH
jgi:hypothetical protein